MTHPVLELRDVTKQFFGVSVVCGVSLDIHAGESIAMLGENGAGKSTLVKMVAGVHPHGSYGGTILLDGKELTLRNVREAEAWGVVLVQQELHIASNLPIAENAAMGALPRKLGIVNRGAMIQHTEKCLAFFGIDADPMAPMATLSASEQRLLMIASKLVRAEPRLLILDEPTAALTPSEAAFLYRKMKEVNDKGVPTVFITHRLDEVEQVCDRAFVMRNGHLVHQTAKIKGGRDDIIRAMIGREPEERAARNATLGDTRLVVKDLMVRQPGKDVKPVVNGASLTVRGGEIVGLFGLVGAGQTELAEAIFGAWHGEVTGHVVVNGQEGVPKSPRDALARKCAMLSEDRKWSGIFEGQNLLKNMTSASISDVSRFGVLQRFKEFERNMGLARGMDLRPLDLSRMIENLSGGNQQKVLLCRWLATRPDLLIIDEPTFGVDVGARAEIYRILEELAKAGTAVLMISSDIEEVVNESDRIVVMYKGRVTGEFPARTSAATLMAAATGAGSADIPGKPALEAEIA